MGCMYSRDRQKQSPYLENALLSSYERSLVFSVVNIDTYEVKFNRLLLSSMVPLQGYRKLVGSLNLKPPKDFTKSLELSFAELAENSYLCLFIYLLLLGKGGNSTRLKVIWHLFDSDLKNKLARDQIEGVFSAIVASAVTFSVNYSILKSERPTHNDLMKDWKKKLLDNSAEFSKELTSKFKAGDYISKEQFIETVLKEIPYILDLKKTRELLDKFTYDMNPE